MSWTGPLLKNPHPLRSLKDRWERRKSKRAAKRLRDKAAMDAWLLVRAAIWRRDKGRCRVCGRPVWLSHDNPFKVAACHHIIYRSAGGGDHSGNLVTVCIGCHSDEHDRHIIEMSGNGDDVLEIAFYDPVSYRLIERKESPCPTR